MSHKRSQVSKCSADKEAAISSVLQVHKNMKDTFKKLFQEQHNNKKHNDQKKLKY